MTSTYIYYSHLGVYFINYIAVIVRRLSSCVVASMPPPLCYIIPEVVWLQPSKEILYASCGGDLTAYMWGPHAHAGQALI